MQHAEAKTRLFIGVLQRSVAVMMMTIQKESGAHCKNRLHVLYRQLGQLNLLKQILAALNQTMNRLSELGLIMLKGGLHVCHQYPVVV